MSELESCPNEVEIDDLNHYEHVITTGLKTFVQVGNALVSIRDRRLYRGTYHTFEDYCRERWGFSDSRARQLISAAETVTTVTVHGLPAPTNEAQARELSRVPDEQRAEVWQRVVEETEGKPTAAAVRAAMVPPPAPLTPEDQARIAEARQVVEAMRPDPEQVELERRQRVETDLLTDLISSLALLAGGTPGRYYMPSMASPRPLTLEQFSKTRVAVDEIEGAFRERGLL